MKKIKFNFLKIAIFLTILTFTFILRTHNYDKVPPLGHLEEHLYGWAGMYLIETGVPVSWSTLDYPKRATVFSGEVDFMGGQPKAYITLRKPWLDEPPLFSLLVGWVAHLNGADRGSIIHSAHLRLPSIVLAVGTTVLIFMVAKTISGYWTGILAMLVYGTTPIAVFASRMAVPENMIAFILILLVYLLLKFDIKGKLVYLLPTPFLIGIAGLSKPTGFFLLPFIAYFVLTKKFYKIFIYLIVATVPFVVAFFLYGIYFDAEIFWKVFSLQSLRPIGFSNLGWFFVSPSYDIYTLQFVDGWYIFSLLCGFYFLLNKAGRKEWIISFAFVYWLSVVIFTGGEGDLLPWYRFPMFPLLSILGALGLKILVEKANFFTTVLAAGLLLGSRHLIVNAFRPNITPTSFRIIFSSLILPSVFYSIYPRDWLRLVCKIIVIGIIAAGVYLNSIYIYNQFEIKCEGAECPFGPPTKLSSVYFPFFWRWISIGETPEYKPR